MSVLLLRPGDGACIFIDFEARMHTRYRRVRVGARRGTVEYEGSDPTAEAHSRTVRTAESEAGGTRFETAGVGSADRPRSVVPRCRPVALHWAVGPPAPVVPTLLTPVRWNYCASQP